MPSSTVVAALCLAVAALFVLTRRKNTANLPPSPPRLPILGNALSVPKGVPTWEAFDKFGKDLSAYWLLHLSETLANGTAVRLGYLLHGHGRNQRHRSELVQGC